MSADKPELIPGEAPQAQSYDAPCLIEYGYVEELTHEPSIPGGGSGGSTVIP